ncbi:acylphosphatase [Alcanivorax sp. JB21]|uniref:acylphosphatase n=1 Tax=Alcanivorax limicola TaxID=2874102 RepID=UPI001CBAAD8B|nr:acylphosphatase [Alcanivorax limicola]MBZ2188441.1 acylphosphatase [Alcanivorax limicola]
MAETTLKAWHVRVQGRVQGVFYRASTQQQAHQLGLRGWVRNCDDGSVEALLCGEQAALDAMLAWMAQGPARARVDTLQKAPAEVPDNNDFEVRA